MRYIEKKHCMVQCRVGKKRMQMGKAIAGILFTMWCAGTVTADVVFQDDFQNNSGSLGGRLTDDGKAIRETPQNMVVTNGVLVAGSGVKPGSGWIS
jgi:hypothetical protein